MAELSSADKELVATAIALMERAYCPYSRYAVGCALRDNEGGMHVGVNVENAAYPVGTCAEAGAIAAMVAAGGKKVVAVAVAGEGDALASPCGACRQRLGEFAAPGMRVMICGPEGLRESHELGFLLPASFYLDANGG